LKRLVFLFLLLLATAAPTAVHADVGSTVVGRLWDSAVSTTQNRLKERQPATVTLLQDAERFFLNGTRDVTAMVAVQEVYKAMRVAGLLLLGLCTVISLSQVTEAGLMGESSNIMDWVKRFGVAAFMTMGSIHFYGLWIRIFNAMLDGFRGYLDTHWAGRGDPTEIYTRLIWMLDDANTFLVLLFALVMLLVLLILWFLIGGVRVAELALAVIISPLVWPVYLIPALDDIPKAAFRSFLGLNATLLIIVAMLRLAVQMDVGAGIGNTIWNFVPSISMLILTIFLPTMIKRLTGQGNTGSGGLMTAAYMLAGLKGLSMAAKPGNKDSIPSPPAASSVPQAPAGASAYPIAPVPSNGAATGHHATSQPQAPAEAISRNAARQVHAGATAARPALEAPWTITPEQPAVIEMGQSDPGSDSWDQIIAIERFMQGARDARRPDDNK